MAEFIFVDYTDIIHMVRTKDTPEQMIKENILLGVAAW